MKANPNHSFGLDRSYMLKSTVAISSLYQDGKSVYKFPFTAKSVLTEDHTEPAIQVVFSVPKRKVPKAHDRNLIKRRIKESFRQNKSDIESLLGSKRQRLQLLLIYSTHKMLSYQEIDAKLQKFLQVIQTSITDEK